MDSGATAFGNSTICSTSLTATGVASASIAALVDFKNPYRNAEAAVLADFTASKEGTVKVTGDDTSNVVTIETCLAVNCTAATAAVPAIVAEDGTITKEAVEAAPGVDYSANAVVVE